MDYKLMKLFLLFVQYFRWAHDGSNFWEKPTVFDAKLE